MSLSRPGLHPLDKKLHVAAHHAYKGIELFIDDLTHYAASEYNNSLPAAARSISALAKHLNLSIICLQPFGFYEGLTDRSQTEYLLTQKLPLWFDLARILDTDLIQIPANFLSVDPETGEERTTGSKDVIVSDLRRLADIGAREGFRFVYEALCFSTHADTWESAWEVVKAVDRENFGICLDSFNIAGRIYADPEDRTGKTRDAESAVKRSMENLRRLVASGELDVKKIFYVQLVDGERLFSPLDSSHEFYVPGQPARMSWSRNARLFPCEEDRGGYLPILEIAKTFFDIGFEGWVSLELFSRTCNDAHPDTPAVHAERGIESWRKLVSALGLNADVPIPSSRVTQRKESHEREMVPVQHRL